MRMALSSASRLDHSLNELCYSLLILVIQANIKLGAEDFAPTGQLAVIGQECHVIIIYILVKDPCHALKDIFAWMSNLTAS